MSINIEETGLFTSIQDLGRTGFSAFGVPKSGVMDRYAAKFANMLVGNPQEKAVLECTLMGPKLSFDAELTIAVSGLGAKVQLNGQTLALNKAFRVAAKDVLHVQQVTQGARAYIAIKGGFSAETILGSKSMYASLTGKANLQKGDVLHVENPKANSLEDSDDLHAHLKFNTESYADQIGVFPGPEYQFLPKSIQEVIVDNLLHISKNNSRMAYQIEEDFPNDLEGMLTQPVLPGTVQLTPDGKLIILMRDCQTTGGYPRVLQVSEQGLNRLAQKKQGDKLSFQWI